MKSQKKFLFFSSTTPSFVDWKAMRDIFKKYNLSSHELVNPQDIMTDHDVQVMDEFISNYGVFDPRLYYNENRQQYFEQLRRETP